MTVLRIPKTLYDTAVANDPDAVAVASEEFWGGDTELHLGQDGQIGATYDDDGNELTPNTHYVWGDNRLYDPEALVDFSEALGAAATGTTQPAPPENESQDELAARRQAARQRARTAARLQARADAREERVAQRRAERQARRQELRQAARPLYRADARRAERQAERRGETFTPWPEWVDAAEEVQELYLLEAANQAGHPDVNLV